MAATSFVDAQTSLVGPGLQTKEGYNNNSANAEMAQNAEILYFSKILEVLTIFKVSDFPVYNAIKSGRHLINPETGIFYKITKIY